LDRTTRTSQFGQIGEVSYIMSARKRQRKEDGQNITGRKGLGQDTRDRITVAGHSAQDSWGRIVKTGQLRHVSLDSLA
jgi:hypothetical protein